MDLKRKANIEQEQSKKLKPSEIEKSPLQETIFLPNEILEAIFKVLPSNEIIISVRRVCKDWKQIIESCDSLWKDLCILRWKEENESRYIAAPNWFRRFIGTAKLKNNWKKGKNKLHQIDGHFGTVSSVKFDNTRIVSASEDKTIRLWDLKTGKLKKSFYGHNETTWDVVFQEDKMASVGGDGEVKFWNMNTAIALHTWRDHIGPVWSVDMDLKNKVIVSGGNDTKTRLYDLEKMKGISDVFSTAAVFKVQLSDKLLATGSKDANAHIFDLRVGEFPVFSRKHNFQFNGNSIFSLQFEDNTLMTGHGNGNLIITDLRSEKSSSVSCHIDSVWGLTFNSDYIVTGSVDRTLKLLSWEISDPSRKSVTPLYSFKNSHPVFSVQMDLSKIIFGDNGGLIQALDFNNELDWGTNGKNAQELQSAFSSSVHDFHYDERGKLQYSIF